MESKFSCDREMKYVCQSFGPLALFQNKKHLRSGVGFIKLQDEGYSK